MTSVLDMDTTEETMIRAAEEDEDLQYGNEVRVQSLSMIECRPIIHLWCSG